MLMLMLSRDATRWLGNQADQKWERWYHPELAGQTCGIIGLGYSGKDLALKLKAFHMRVIGTRRTPQPTPNVDEVFPLERLHELLAQSDFVVMTAPRTPETLGMLGEAEFRAMKPGAFYICYSRGGIAPTGSLSTPLVPHLLLARGHRDTTPCPEPPAGTSATRAGASRTTRPCCARSRKGGSPGPAWTPTARSRCRQTARSGPPPTPSSRRTTARRRQALASAVWTSLWTTWDGTWPARRCGTSWTNRPATSGEYTHGGRAAAPRARHGRGTPDTATVGRVHGSHRAVPAGRPPGAGHGSAARHRQEVTPAGFSDGR